MNYSIAQVRAQDPDRFHLAMMAPCSVQEFWLALAALNLELARVSSRVSDPNLGRIRLQWWRDTFEHMRVEGFVRAHQVVQDLARFHAYLDFEILETLIACREANLTDEPFVKVDALCMYLKQSSGSLLVAQSRSLQIPDAEEMALHLGCAFGFVGIARAVAGKRTKGLRLPTQWMKDPLVCLREARQQAARHVDRAQKMRAGSPHFKSMAPLFAMGCLIKWWLNVFDRVSEPLGRSLFLRPLPFQALRLSFTRFPPFDGCSLRHART